MSTRRQNKEIEAELLVWVDIDGQAVLCGVLQLDDQSEDRFFAQFNYVQSWLDNPDAFALDPLNLPLVDAHTTFSTSNRVQALGALFDAAPDAWGRNVIRVDKGASAHESEVLLKGRGMGAGAILFSASHWPGKTPHYPVPAIEQIDSLADLLADIDAGIRPKAQYRNVLGSSWDIGGARPKTVVRDVAGQLWIAKFPRTQDTFDRQKVEYANLAMARAIGLNVPENQLIPIHKAAAAVLLSRRFDREIRHTPTGTTMFRRHYVSGASLISPPVDALKRQIDTPRGQAVYSYARLAEIVRKISSNPIKDLIELYTRMVLNVAVHNTDDHLKNTGFLKEERSHHYRLAPLFDVVTQEGHAPHMLHLGAKGRESSFENALSHHRRFGLRAESVAVDIIERVRSVVARRRQYYEEAGLSAAEVDQVESSLVAWHGGGWTRR